MATALRRNGNVAAATALRMSGDSAAQERQLGRSNNATQASRQRWNNSFEAGTALQVASVPPRGSNCPSSATCWACARRRRR